MWGFDEGGRDGPGGRSSVAVHVVVAVLLWLLVLPELRKSAERWRKGEVDPWAPDSMHTEI